MDPLLQPLLRLATTGAPKEVSTDDAKDQIETFMAEFKMRCGADAAGDAQDVSNAGGVIMSQLINLRNGLASEEA